MDYAVIRVGNKQHRVRDGETLVAHGRGPKIRIGKYRKRTGYKRHNGFRAATSRIEISFGGEQKAAKPKPKAAEPVTEVADEPATETVPAGLPAGYADLKVADVAKAAKEWDREQVEAALEYEQA